MAEEPAEPSADPEVGATEDPLTKALLVAQSQAEAKQKIAEAKAATAAALLPALPTTLPAQAIDVTNAGTSFATVNSYRAALECAANIAREVAAKTTRVWLAPGSLTTAPKLVRIAVEQTLDDASAALDELQAELRTSLPGTPLPAAELPAAEDHGFVVKALPVVPLVAAAVSAGLPLLFDAFSSTTTLKGADTDLDDEAVRDLVTRELLAEGIHVIRADANAPIDGELLARAQGLQDGVREVRRLMRRTTDLARTEGAQLAPLQLEQTLRQEALTAVLQDTPRDMTKIQADIAAIATIARTAAQHEQKKSAAEARVADGESVLAAIETALAGLKTLDDQGFTPIAHASFATRIAAEPSARLEVLDVSAGTESQYHDNKIKRDFAIHTGSATVTYRLVAESGEIIAAGAFVSTESCKVDLTTGVTDWT